MAFFPAVMIAAYFGGFWPGLLATVLSAAAANYFFTGQLRSFHITNANDIAALVLFVLTGAIISGLSESLHRARRRVLAHERQRAEEALSQERYLLHSLMDNLPDNIYFKDTASRFIRINKALTSYFGLGDPAQAIGKTDFDFFTEEHARPAYADEQEIMKTGRPVVGKEEKETWLDGRVRWVSTTKMPFRDTNDKIIGTFGLARDITNVKLAEEALRESEQRWRNLTEALPQLVWSARPDGACDYFSTQWTEHTGVPESDLLGWRWMETLHPDDREPTRRLWTESVAGRGPYDVEYRVRRRDGVYRWFKTRGVPIRDGEGKIVKWFGSCTDITDLRQAEEALRENRERLDLVVQSTELGLWYCDLPFDKLAWNAKCKEHFGLPPDADVTIGLFYERLHPEDRERTRQAIERCIGHHGTYDVEYRTVGDDGRVRWIRAIGRAFYDHAGKPIRFDGVTVDDTRQKRAEEDLRHAKEAAEAANRAKDEFLANVSHEIRTPMNAILGMTELALDTPLTEDQRQCLTTVKSAADNLLGIINDLLDFSKIAAGKLELAPADFSLRAAVGDTLRALAVRAHNKGLELIYHVQPEVPDALIGDAGRLRQVLLNLVGNAIKFTDEGEVVVRVEVAALQKSGVRSQESERPTSPIPDSSLLTPDSVSLRFSVRDTGIGIPKEKQEKIFRAFEQEDTSTTRRYGGTGPGLTIASQLVALMGGNITVDSALGRGSTFAFTAQFGRQSDRPEQPAARPNVLPQDLLVLIVDDNATNRHLLDGWLRGWQIKPVAVGDGLAAMDALWHGAACGRPYALVLLDARMPDVEGLALAAQIRQRAELSATRIILLTSGDRPGDLARSREVRVDAHLLKPVRQDELLDTIYRVMSRQTVSGRVVSGEWSEPPLPTTHHSPFTDGLRILVAEDNEFNAQLLEQLLGRRGHLVRVANNGREALALAEEEAFDLLLLDVHMPELDGFQVARAIREQEQPVGSHLPIIALTARSRKEDREQCMAAGMDDFLVKPIQAADLWETIERVAGARRIGSRGSRVRGQQSGVSSSLTPDPCLLIRCSTRACSSLPAEPTRLSWKRCVGHFGRACPSFWRRFREPCTNGTRCAFARPLTSSPELSQHFPPRPVAWRLTSKITRLRAGSKRRDAWWNDSSRWPTS
jgi:PAS domain S-box-containing protein